MTDTTTRRSDEPLSAQDLWEIRQVLALHSHIVDSGAWAELGLVFADDAELEEGGRVWQGLEEIADHEGGGRSGSAYAHHTVNTVIRGSSSPGIAHAWSRSITLTPESRAEGGDLLDTLRREESGWRIVRRRVTGRDLDAGVAYRPSDGESFATWLELP